MRHLSFPDGITRRTLIEWFREGRARSREIFAIPKAEMYYERPIPLRNPIVFYEGHLPAFTVNTLLKLALQEPGVDAGYEVLFERGIDPESIDAAKPTSNQWPVRRDVQAYGAEADRRIEHALCDATIEDDRVPQLRGAEAAIAILEHEQMHQETLLYMFHEMPYEKKNPRRPLAPAPPAGGGRRAGGGVAGGGWGGAGWSRFRPALQHSGTPASSDGTMSFPPCASRFPPSRSIASM